MSTSENTISETGNDEDECVDIHFEIYYEDKVVRIESDFQKAMKRVNQIMLLTDSIIAVRKIRIFK